ncbi:MAG: hypothetical protein DRJ01_16965, partial [Bacteroidetes bacterium]
PDPTYPTLLTSDGARHIIDPLIYMGNSIDPEIDGQPDATATGDDLANFDDEDGVIFVDPLYIGQLVNVNVTVSVDGFINAWIDYDIDGGWAEVNDQIFTDVFVTAGTNALSFNVPASIAVGTTFARFRFNTTGGLTYTGYAANGEVEDYEVYIKEEPHDELDFGDAPDPTYPTLLVNNGARHILDGVTYLGAQVDAEPDGQPDANATGDDNDGNNDEDGVLFVSPLIPGEQGAVYVQASANGLLNAWIDFDGNGLWETSEQIFTDKSLISGWNSLNFSVPISAIPGNTFARFRFDTGGGLGTTGIAPNGEVEDYQVEIEEDLHDGSKMHYHQWPDTTSFGMDVNATDEGNPLRIIADDFLCVETGPINSIHIWGSYYSDDAPLPYFDLAIWSDNPSGANGWSEPNTLLWQKQFVPGEYDESIYYETPNGEWWYDPCNGQLEFPGDYEVREFHFTIPDTSAFIQEAGTVYWLSVRAWFDLPSAPPWFGWKTSPNHWNDDAVFDCMFPSRQNWQELIYPYEHPFNLSGEEHVSMDMAFYIDCHPSKPVNVTISKNSTNITLQWDPVSCATYYNVYSSTDPYATFPSGWTLEPTGTHITITTWNDPVSTAGNKKFYRVTAEN